MAVPATAAETEPAARRKLSYRQARELEQLPARIETLEASIAELAAAMNDPGFYLRDAAQITADTQRIAALQEELDAAYARWQELEA